MRKINSYMNKLGIDEGDAVKIGKHFFKVNEDGYLTDLLGDVDFNATMKVLFGLAEFSLPNVDTIKYQDYTVLELAKSWGYKKVILDHCGEMYVTKLSKKNLKNFLDSKTPVERKVPILGVNGVGQISKVPTSLKSRFIFELNIGKIYSINFLIRRYKNRVLE